MAIKAVKAAVMLRKLFSKYWNPVLAGCLISSIGLGGVGIYLLEEY